MKKVFFLIFIFLTFSSCVTLYSLNTVTLMDSQGKYRIGKSIEYFEDKTGKLTSKDIIKPEISGQFIKSTELSPNLKYTRSAYWVRFKLKNDSMNWINWILKMDYYWFSVIDFFIPQDNGTFLSKRTGYIYPIETQDIKAGKYIFRFNLERGQTKTFYMRFRTNDLMILGLTLYSYDRYIEEDHETQMIFGLYYGIFAIMIIYNLVLFFFIGDRSYLYYVFFVFFLILSQLQSNGLYYEYIRPLTKGWLPFDLYDIILGALIFFSVKFATSFLRSKTYAPVLHKVSYIFLAYGVLSAILGFFVHSSILDPLTDTVFIIIAIGGFALASVCLIKGNKTALYYMAAFIFSFFGTVIAYLSSYGFIPFNELALNADEIGTVFMVVTLSIALAYRYKAMREKKEYAEHISLEQTDFFINLSHEVKTPLTLITNYLDTYISIHGITKELTVVKQNIDKLLRDMINFFDVLKFRKGMVLYNHSQVINFSILLKSKVILFKEIALKNGITISTTIEENIYLKADPLAIERLINNLLENAVKFNRQDGSIDVDLQLLGGKLCLTMSNTGLRVDEKEQKNIFTPYYQISHRKYNMHGIGMGLSIVKGVVDSLNGEIKVRNNEKEGCTFSITLNGYVPDKDEVITKAKASFPPHEISAVQSNTELTYTSWKSSESILLVEDNRDLLYFMFHELKNRYNVFTAVNGREALKILEQEPAPDVIVSDIMMDDMDGYELLEVVRRTDGFNDIPFIFITAITTIDEKLKGLQKGAIDLIFKPFKVDELLFKINSILRYRSLQKENYEREKFASLGMLMGGIAHEIFNPLSGITGPLDNIRKITDKCGLTENEKLKKYFNYIDESAERIEKIVRSIRALYQNKKLEKEPVDFTGIVNSVIEEQELKHEGNAEFKLDIDKSIKLHANQYALHAILTNLISNALDAVGDNGEINISLKKENEKTIIRVADNGKGMDSRELEKVFNAFYTTKDDRNRIGLGLYLVKDLVIKLGCDIRANSTKGKGTVFTILTEE